VAGSPVTMPRQQVINFKYAKPDVDVWAMAATLYYALTGYYPRPFSRKRDPFMVVLESTPVPIRERNASIPKRLADVIDQALIDTPAITFQSAARLKQALEGAL
jgi:eukaryotic-like serine/threonine-protein kinase